MACSSCGTGGCGTKKDGKVGGCRNNGTCGTGGCNKMNVFDWLSNMDLPTQQKFDIVELRFKGGRKDFFRNSNYLDLTTGDYVVVDAGGGYHIGEVALQGELVRLQMLKKKVKATDDIKGIYRIASEKDMEKFRDAQHREMTTLFRTRQIIEELQLKMKLSDIEYQADNTKATFYYSADERVDFRELIKLLAAEFKIRVEMRQISLRQEAARLGGIGSCGRELCCSTWMTDFKSVSTAAARYQNLSLNPAKLSGQCGRLKCCLNYELETYLDALVDIPKVEKPLQTENGEAHLQKTDIFKKILWFSYDTESTWFPLPANKVKLYLALNEQGKLAPALSNDNEDKKTPTPSNNDLQGEDKKKRPHHKDQKRDDITKKMVSKARGTNTRSNSPQVHKNTPPQQANREKNNDKGNDKNNDKGNNHKKK